ncbi:MAG: hypothetical protein BVN35_04930 [Proteobacteria bacterium ST_bin11]|nr:MAG: hypothetical protein BVN35_04930 [Proteobacteria bacterium ST_bin11]
MPKGCDFSKEIVCPLMSRFNQFEITSPLRMPTQLQHFAILQIKLLREYGLLGRLKALVSRILKLSISFLNTRPTLKALILCSTEKIGAGDYIFELYERLSALTEPTLSQAENEQNLSYSQWSAKFDSPSAEILSELEATTDYSRTFIIARFEQASEQYAEELALRLVANVGQLWQAVFLFSAECKAGNTIQNILHRINADTRISFTLPKALPETEFIVFIEGGALPRPHALRIFTEALRLLPSATMAYSDEDQFNREEAPSNPWLKPQFSPLLARQGLLLGRMLAFRGGVKGSRALLRQLADINAEARAIAINYAIEMGEDRVLHIPHVLYHDALPARPFPIRVSLPEKLPFVSIIIPTRDRWDLLGPCLESIKRTEWPAERLEIIVIDNGSTDSICLTMLEKAADEQLIRVIRDDFGFNWSRLNNLATLNSRGSLLLFLNNDTKVLDELWLKKMAVHAFQPDTGAVGCKLLYPDGSVQHGGVITGIQHAAVHAHSHLDSSEGGYRDLAITTREVLAVTGACLAVTRENYEAVGGFNEGFQTVFNDIVFCLDLHTLGKRNVYVADPLLMHFESKSRGHDDTPEKLAHSQAEVQRVCRLHPKLMQSDPFYSPNLSNWTPYNLSLAPRRRVIWDYIRQQSDSIDC